MTVVADWMQRRDDGPFDGDHHRELIERSAAIQELTGHPGWAYLTDYVIHLTTADQRYVISGSCKDDRDYARRTGKIEGMLAVIEAPEKLQSQLAATQAANRPQEED